MSYKHANRAECYRLYVEEGVQDIAELARRAELSRTTVRAILTAEAREDHHRRCREARRLYVEQGVSDVNAICAQAKIHKNLFFKLHDASWDEARAKHVAENPVLFRTAELLYQAAEKMLTEVKVHGYQGQTVSHLITLANAFEKFRTGEFRMEMILMGVTDFAVWFRDNARNLGFKRLEVQALQRALDAFRQTLVARLEAQG